jgi:hypothetical protein
MLAGMTRSSARAGAKLVLTLLPALAALGCDDSHGGSGGGGGAGGSVPTSPVIISTATRTPRTATWSVNYWTWPTSYGNDVAGTEAQIAALMPAVMRVGGYNNDANTPDPFDDAALDAAVAYARAIGAQPLIQVPLLADTGGQPPTAATAAAMVTYANLTKGYGVKYFSIGNEPDIYATSGSLVDSTLPAIPGYLPSDYCASARAYVPAMKAADPSIQIVGPDLAYRYVSGNDWLTPILQGCGELFDIVAIHRYPFSALQATLPSAQADVSKYRAAITSIRGLMQAAGYGDRPLALTEMNVAYDATPAGSMPAAAPATVPSALWLADSLGATMGLGLWTSAIWDISDAAPYALGILEPPPAHTPRPEYYAYALYAGHFGPTLVEVTQAPAGVNAYASRDAADAATLVIAVNWNTSSAALSFQVTGLPTAPAAAIFQLPPLSMAAVEIPDHGAPSAWIYGDAQHQAGAGPQPLPPGAVAVAGADGGIDGAGGGADTAAPFQCAQLVLPAPTITTLGTMSGSSLSFGPAAASWASYTYAASGQTAPTIAVTADGNGIQITDDMVAPTASGNNYAGAGLYFNSSSCVDGSAYTGVQFDFSGDLGGCALALGASFSGDLSSAGNPGRGSCAGSSSTCYGPAAAVVPAAAGTSTIQVPFSRLSGGVPIDGFDQSTLVTVQWQLTGPAVTLDGGGTCAANFTVENVAFY